MGVVCSLFRQRLLHRVHLPLDIIKSILWRFLRLCSKYCSYKILALSDLAGHWMRTANYNKGSFDALSYNDTIVIWWPLLLEKWNWKWKEQRRVFGARHLWFIDSFLSGIINLQVTSSLEIYGLFYSAQCCAVECFKSWQSAAPVTPVVCKCRGMEQIRQQ